MANVIRAVQDIQQRAQLGRLTEDERAERYINVLLARVAELEQHLLPFVRAFEINRLAPSELVSVYYRDVAAAYNVMDPMLSVAVETGTDKSAPEPEGLMGEVF